MNQSIEEEKTDQFYDRRTIFFFFSQNVFLIPKRERLTLLVVKIASTFATFSKNDEKG